MRLRALAFVFSGLLLFSAGAAAQQGTTEIKGKIIDSSNAAVPGATVVVRNQETGMFRETVSGADGTYFVGGIVPGVYEVTAELQGFKKLGLKDIRPRDRQDGDARSAARGRRDRGGGLGVRRLSARRRHDEGGRRQHHRARARRPAVDQPQLHRLHRSPARASCRASAPSRSDRIRSRVNGADPRNNNYMLDGGNNNDDVIGQRAGTQARTAIESVQEFQVITNQFDAQFGRTTGAIINAVTKSGTNVFHGSGFVFAQDADWTAKDYFAQGAQPLEAGHEAPGIRRHDRRARSSRTRRISSGASSAS